MGVLACRGGEHLATTVAEAPPAYGAGSRRLLDRVRSATRMRRMSCRSEQAHVFWIRRCIVFHDKRHPATLGAKEVTRVLSHLAEDRRVSASTQNQALSALRFRYRQVLGVERPWLDGLVHARRPAHVPVVPSREEVAAVLSRLSGPSWLMGAPRYGAGLRLLECLRLRVKDVEFARGEIVVRRGKGGRDRRSVLPAVVRRPLAAHLDEVRAQHEAELARGAGWVELPDALARKYPKAGHEWAWQWVFPATRTYVHPETGQRRRHHFHEPALQRLVRQAVIRAGVAKPAGCHTVRHSFGTDLLERGSDIGTVQERLGHRDVRTTMIYTHVSNRGGLGVVRPVDVVLGALASGGLPRGRSGTVRMDGEALPPIRRKPAQVAIEDRREISNVTQDTRAPMARNRPRARRRECDWTGRPTER